MGLRSCSLLLFIFCTNLAFAEFVFGPGTIVCSDLNNELASNKAWDSSWRSWVLPQKSNSRFLTNAAQMWVTGFLSARSHDTGINPAVADEPEKFVENVWNKVFVGCQENPSSTVFEIVEPFTRVK